MKIKKFLAILSSVMVISACAVSPIYAEETATEPTESEQTKEKITDLDEITKLISDFIKENELDAFAGAGIDYSIRVNDASESNVVLVTVNVLYDWKEKEIVELIEAFINEIGIDERLVKFCFFEGSTPVNGAPIVDTSITIRTAAGIARDLATGAKDLINEYPDADYNGDGVVNIRDAAAIARDLATRK